MQLLVGVGQYGTSSANISYLVIAGGGGGGGSTAGVASGGAATVTVNYVVRNSDGGQYQTTFNN